MVVTTISGGLGNQMFMYAAARALSLRLNTSLVLNLDLGFKRDFQFHRQFEMGCFDLKYIHDRILEFNYPGSLLIRKLSKFLGRNILAPSYLYYIDSTSGLDVDENFFKLTGNVYLDGYWQSEEYFYNYKDQIRKDFSFVEQPSSATMSELDKIHRTVGTPVCLGVRRYQECANPILANLTSEDYYIKAMKYIQSQIKEPVFYVFTQDKEWVKERLMKGNSYKFCFIEDKDNSTQNDMFLMTQFKYHIICNSTFYWWGAWLANGEMVISNNNFKCPKTNCKQWIIM